MATATYRITFTSETIKRLSSEDFNIDTKDLITSKYDDCMLILFYTENAESSQLANIWASVAQQVAGPIFGAINMLSERKVAEAFTRLKGDGSHPLHWASLRQYPFILVYRKKWPVAAYNGTRDVQALIDYSLTLACEAGYYEMAQVGGSMQATVTSDMPSYKPYVNIVGSPDVVRKTSLQYTSDNPIRGFNTTVPNTPPNNTVPNNNTTVPNNTNVPNNTLPNNNIRPSTPVPSNNTPTSTTVPNNNTTVPLNNITGAPTPPQPVRNT